MTKYILVGGYVKKAPDGGRAFFEELVSGFDSNKIIKILYCVFADPLKAEVKFNEDKEKMSEFISNFTLELAEESKFLEQVKESDVVFLKGGETDLLLGALNKHADWVKYLDKKTVAGTSAGAMAIAKYSHALEQDNIMEGLGLLPVKVIAHWQSDIYDIDWSQALYEVKNYKEDLPVYTLAEGEFVVIEK